MQKYSTPLLAAAILLPTSAFAATVTTSEDLSYSASDDLIISGGGFNKSFNVDLGIAVVDFGARASTGEVDADVSAKVSATYKNRLKLNEAGNAAVSLTASNLKSAFDTFIGATAFTGINFDRIQIPVPFLPDIDINPPRISLGEVGYSMETSGQRNGFGSVSDRAVEPISGFGSPSNPVVSLQAEVTLDGSQTSELSVDDIFGIVRATHESGAVFQDAFSILSDSVSSLDLGRTGSWDLELVGVGIANTWDSSLGLAASARAGFALGPCGDPSTDSDNQFGCIFDTGAVATTPQLTLINPAPFGLDFGLKNVSLGAVDVVPLPAGLGLMLGGLGVMGFAARRRKPA